jgi:hypothetical protein
MFIYVQYQNSSYDIVDGPILDGLLADSLFRGSTVGQRKDGSMCTGIVSGGWAETIRDRTDGIPIRYQRIKKPLTPEVQSRTPPRQIDMAPLGGPFSYSHCL